MYDIFLLAVEKQCTIPLCPLYKARLDRMHRKNFCVQHNINFTLVTTLSTCAPNTSDRFYQFSITVWIPSLLEECFVSFSFTLLLSFQLNMLSIGCTPQFYTELLFAAATQSFGCSQLAGIIICAEFYDEISLNHRQSCVISGANSKSRPYEC